MLLEDQDEVIAALERLKEQKEWVIPHGDLLSLTHATVMPYQSAPSEICNLGIQVRRGNHPVPPHDATMKDESA